MLQEKEQREARSNLYDRESVYGWISIFLHWVTAIVIIALWLIGRNIANTQSDGVDAMRQLHVSIAASAWLVILIRVVWRFRSSHPHVNGQTLFIHRIAKVTHYTMLLAVVLMLISGPTMVWSSGNSINIFGWFSMPGPIGESESIRDFAWFVHSNSAWLLLWLVLLHIAGTLKHLMFHADDTIVRMLWPGKKTRDQ
jgi:cytochrome b561